MRKFFVFFNLILSLYVFAQDKSFDVLGSGASNFIVQRNLKFVSVDNSCSVKMIEQDAKLDDDVDLIIHFDGANEKPLGNYMLTDGAVQPCFNTKIIGAASGNFKFNGGSLRLEPYSNAIFAPQNEPQDFEISFYIFPTMLDQNETVFYWSNSFVRDNEIVYQYINCSLDGERVKWVFRNFFFNDELNTIILEGQRDLKVGKWYHIRVLYNFDESRLELIQDNVTQEIKHCSKDGLESYEPWTPVVGDNIKSGIIIGKSFNGKIDEFVIRKKFKEDLCVSRFGDSTGTLISKPFDLKYSGNYIKSIEADFDNQNYSNVNLFYRATEDRFTQLQWYNIEDIDGQRDMDIWQPLDKPFLDNIRGRYFQVMAIFYPGSSKNISPVLNKLSFSYEPNLPPMPPVYINVKPLNGSALIEWIPTISKNIVGFKIFYGTKSKTYTESITVSEVNRNGNKMFFLVDGLENGVLYYFSVVAFDDAPVSQLSEFSKEVSARPARKYKFQTN